MPLQIWQRIDGKQMVCYNIFQRLSDKCYAVLSKDFYRIDDMNDLINEFNKQRIELFIDDDIEARESFFTDVEKAIEAFDASFEADN